MPRLRAWGVPIRKLIRTNWMSTALLMMFSKRTSRSTLTRYSMKALMLSNQLSILLHREEILSKVPREAQIFWIRCSVPISSTLMWDLWEAPISKAEVSLVRTAAPLSLNCSRIQSKGRTVLRARLPGVASTKIKGSAWTREPAINQKWGPPQESKARAQLETRTNIFQVGTSQVARS